MQAGEVGEMIRAELAREKRALLEGPKGVLK
jgi:hypothetical protein